MACLSILALIARQWKPYPKPAKHAKASLKSMVLGNKPLTPSSPPMKHRSRVRILLSIFLENLLIRWLLIVEEEVGQSSKRHKRLLNEAQYLLHLHSPTDGKGIRRRIDEYRSLISQAIDRVYLDVQHYDFLMDQITLLEDKLVQLKIEPAPEKVQTSHTSETKNA